jgi:plasmid stabilization system protein ParE
MSYTEKEKQDIYRILDFTFQNPETRQRQIADLKSIGGDSVIFHYTLNPPPRCGDGKRRYSPGEYLDYLIPNPTLDVLLENATAADPKYIYSYSLGANGILECKVTTKTN